MGQPLGDSATPPNAASAVGAEAAQPVRQPDEYEFGDVFPDAAQLRFGMSYHGDPLVGRDMPAAHGAQICDLSGQPTRQAASDAAPHPVAGPSRTRGPATARAPTPA